MRKKRIHRLDCKDNHGTTIIEVIVVMAILAIFVAGTTNIVGRLRGKQANQCAYKMEAVLSEIRTETMSKSNGDKESVYLTIANEDGSIYAELKIRDDTNRHLLGKDVTVKAYPKVGAAKTLVEGSKVQVYFERSTGALYSDNNNYCKFEIKQGNVTYVVNIIPETGKISYERL